MRALLDFVVMLSVFRLIGGLLLTGLRSAPDVLDALETAGSVPPETPVVQEVPEEGPAPAPVVPPAAAEAPPVARQIETPAPSGEQPFKARLAREDVMAGMQQIAPSVKQCGTGKGTLTAEVLITEAGRAEEIRVRPPYDKKPVGPCAVAAISKAVFPQSKQRLRVVYPFKL